jgi:hypothetical protein
VPRLWFERVWLDLLPRGARRVERGPQVLSATAAAGGIICMLGLGPSTVVWVFHSGVP